MVKCYVFKITQLQKICNCLIKRAARLYETLESAFSLLDDDWSIEKG